MAQFDFDTPKGGNPKTPAKNPAKAPAKAPERRKTPVGRAIPPLDNASTDEARTPGPKKLADKKVAIALNYDPGHEDAPRVAARGEGHVADQIIELAQDHGVEIKKDEDLAQILSKLDVDSVIPVEVFATVAEILTYIYQVNGDKKGKLAEARREQRLDGGE